MMAMESRKQREPENLHERYGKIGISAVTAALPYEGDAKYPAYAPVTPRDDRGGTTKRRDQRCGFILRQKFA
jgi:hypothetical protein